MNKNAILNEERLADVTGGIYKKVITDDDISFGKTKDGGTASC